MRKLGARKPAEGPFITIYRDESSYCVQRKFERAADTRALSDALAGCRLRVEGVESHASTALGAHIALFLPFFSIPKLPLPHLEALYRLPRRNAAPLCYPCAGVSVSMRQRATRERSAAALGSARSRIAPSLLYSHLSRPRRPRGRARRPGFTRIDCGKRVCVRVGVNFEFKTQTQNSNSIHIYIILGGR